MQDSLPIYRIKEVVERGKSYFRIIRPDNSVVNDARYDSDIHADRFLETLVAFKYCQREQQ